MKNQRKGRPKKEFRVRFGLQLAILKKIKRRINRKKKGSYQKRAGTKNPRDVGARVLQEKGDRRKKKMKKRKKGGKSPSKWGNTEMSPRPLKFFALMREVGGPERRRNPSLKDFLGKFGRARVGLVSFEAEKKYLGGGQTLQETKRKMGDRKEKRPRGGSKKKCSRTEPLCEWGVPGEKTTQGRNNGRRKEGGK